MSKLTVRDINVKGKRILVRVDFNVPINEWGEITDDKRLKASIPTILYLLGKGGKVILISHLGRPAGKRIKKFSLASCAARLSILLGNIKFFFVEKCIGSEVMQVVDALKEGEVVLLENLRFHSEEIENNLEFAQELSTFADIYVNDAFGVVHRKHASVEGITHFMSLKVMGLLLCKEISYISCVLNNPNRLFVGILGGSKISDKIGIIESLLKKVDLLILGGAMIFTFLKAKGIEVGHSFFERDRICFASQILERYEKKILLPFDFMVTNFLDFNSKVVGKIKYVNIESIQPNWYGIDIGIRTIGYISNILSFAKTIIWNGPVGIFEIKESASGTFALAKAVGQATRKGALSVVGGGDSASAFKSAGLDDKISHISTGGGALLKFIEGEKLPGFYNLSDR